jgi:hypothetical protein
MDSLIRNVAERPYYNLQRGQVLEAMLHKLSSASTPAYVAVSISHLISSKMINLVETT